MLNTTTVSFVRLSDVLTYMGYPELMEDASDIFRHVTWGDSMHTLVMTGYVLNRLYFWLDSTGDLPTDKHIDAFNKKADRLTVAHEFVDMES